MTAVEIQMQLTIKRFTEWLVEDIFHLRWWLLLALYFLSFWIWWKLADKTRLNEIVLFTAIVSIKILILDELGEELALWDYPVDIFPLFPPIAAINLSALPFLYSIIYQTFSKWKAYIVASAVMSVFSCLVFEPLFVLAGIYQMLKWKSYYGLPIYFEIGVVSKLMLSGIQLISRKARKKAL